jgi:hypothetical protein
MKQKLLLPNSQSARPIFQRISLHWCVTLLALACVWPGNARANDVEYAITTANELGTIDFQTGVFTLLGTVPISSGGSFGNITRMPGGLVYGSDTKGRLLLIDPIALKNSYVGNLSSGSVALGNINVSVFRPDGIMFNITYKDNQLYTVDPKTAAATLVATMTGQGFAMTENWFDLKFDSAGHAYLLSRNFLYWLNASTGQLTLLGPTGFNIYALGIEGATLYGFTTDGRIVLLDTSTGAGTKVVATESCAHPIVAVCNGGIMLGAPSLSIQSLNPNTISLSWVAPSNQFRLQQNQNLATKNWTPVTNALNVTNSLHEIIISPSVPMNFFRLIYP